MIISRLHHFCSMELKVVIQLHLAVFNIIHIGTNFIHPVARINGHNIIYPWITEYAIHQVNCFIAAIATEYTVFTHTFHFGYLLLQCFL